MWNKSKRSRIQVVETVIKEVPVVRKCKWKIYDVWYGRRELWSGGDGEIQKFGIVWICRENK